MQKDPKVLDKYNQIMKGQQDAGIIEEVPKYNIPTSGKTYYMLHQLIVPEDRVTTKLHIVYDASSKLHGKSLNESLENVSNKHTDLLSVLLQLRPYKVTLIVNIERAFFMIGVKDTDWDALRFMWVEDPTENLPQIKKKRFTMVCFGVISSMGHLGEAINHHLEEYRNQIPEVMEKTENSLYIDDLSIRADGPKSATELYETAKSIFAKANMNLRK